MDFVFQKSFDGTERSRSSGIEEQRGSESNEESLSLGLVIRVNMEKPGNEKWANWSDRIVPTLSTLFGTSGELRKNAVLFVKHPDADLSELQLVGEAVGADDRFQDHPEIFVPSEVNTVFVMLRMTVADTGFFLEKWNEIGRKKIENHPANEKKDAENRYKNDPVEMESFAKMEVYSLMLADYGNDRWFIVNREDLLNSLRNKTRLPGILLTARELQIPSSVQDRAIQEVRRNTLPLRIISFGDSASSD